LRNAGESAGAAGPQAPGQSIGFGEPASQVPVRSASLGEPASFYGLSPVELQEQSPGRRELPDAGDDLIQGQPISSPFLRKIASEGVGHAAVPRNPAPLDGSRLRSWRFVGISFSLYVFSKRLPEL